MKREDFAPVRRSHLVRTIRDQWAFVPPSLPDDLELSKRTVVALEKAAHALGDLNGAGQWMENPYLLIRPFLRREAVLSSKIEGTQASLSDLVVYEASPMTPTSMPADVREVVNYVHAVDLGLRSSLERPSLSLIRQLHRTLMTGVRGQERSPGEFRTDQNWIGRPRSPIEEASYVPPPPLAMRDALIALETYLRTPTSMPTLAKIALAHYQFEAIHPFWDGNGRVGRLLVTLLLVSERLVRQPLLYLSAFFEQRREEYYRRLAAVSLAGEADEWIAFFLEGVHEQAHDAVERSSRLFKLRRDYQHRVQTARGSALAGRLVEFIFSNPAISVTQAQHELGITYRAAAQHVTRLVDLGMLTEVTQRDRNRVYVAPEVMQLLEADVLPPGDHPPDEPEQQVLAFR